MKRLIVTVVAALIVGSGGGVGAQDAIPRTPLGPPAQLFEATDLAGNPVPAHFFLTAGGGLTMLVGSLDQEVIGWEDRPESQHEKSWAGDMLDFGGGYIASLIGISDPRCAESMLPVYPWPVNVPGSQAFCWNLVVPRSYPNVVGAIAPLTVTTASGTLVFHDWEVADPEVGRCRTGHQGVRAIPDRGFYRGPSSYFPEGVEQRLLGVTADETARARFRAVYTSASPDVSPPLVTVNTPRDCWEIPQGAAATVAFSCRDLGSGIATCSAPPGYENGAAIDTSAYGDFSFDVVATDVSGNTRTRTMRYRVVDVTAPTASPAVPTLPSSGWYTSDVTVTWNWTDNEGGIGLDIDSCPSTTVSSGEGAALVVSATCRDGHGNVATSSVTIPVDKTAPTPDSTIQVFPNPVVQGQPARVISKNFLDDLSGHASFEDKSGTCGDVLTSVPGAFTVACSNSDRAGNTATVHVPYTVTPAPDTTKPTISIVGPADSASYLLNQAVAANYTCSDEAGGSGIASCAGTVAPGSSIDTFSPGSKTFTVTATDQSGNTLTVNRSYNVIAGYTFGGFAQPIDPVPTVNVGKAGKTYPVKFQLFELGIPVSDLAAVTGFTYKATSCDALGGTASDALETDVSGTTSLRYDATSRSFIYNWKTPSTAGCYTLWLTLRTNQQFPAYFQLLK